MILKWHKNKLLSSSTTKGKSFEFFVLAIKIPLQINILYINYFENFCFSKTYFFP